MKTILSLLLFAAMLCGCDDSVKTKAPVFAHGFRMESAHIEANGFHVYTVSIDGVEYVMATNDKGGISIIRKN